jgi:hypothetical protein
MNLKRLLNIAQEADKNGDYVTADKVTNLLKTAQGGAYSVYPNQAAYQRTPQQSQQLKQSPKANASMPSLPDMQNQKQMPSMPQMNQQMPQSGGVYNPGMAAGATYYTPGVVNVAQPQMTDKQKAYADLNGLTGQVQQADQVVKQQSMQPKQYPIYQNAPAEPQYAQVVTPGMNTEEQYNFNPNAPTNMNLYGTGYASKAMQPQQPQSPQTPQQQAQPQQQYPYNQRRNPNS